MAVIDEVGVRRRLRIMLGDEALAETYIVRYGFRIDGQKVEALKAEGLAAKQVTHDEAEPETASDDPVFTVYLKCPACYVARIPSHDMKAKSLQVLVDRFGMPHYHKTARFQEVDFNLLSVTICPQCLYASPDKRDFIARDPARGSEVPARLHQGELAAILAAADERSDWLASQQLDVLEHLMIRERTPRAGIAAYQMAIFRARIEFARNVPFSAYKMGGYALKQMTIANTYGIDSIPYAKAALSSYLTCFERSNAPGFQFDSQILYLIIALGIRLQNLDVAGSYMGVLDRTKSRVETANVDAPTRQAFDRWYAAAREIWSDRENPDLFTPPRA